MLWRLGRGRHRWEAVLRHRSSHSGSRPQLRKEDGKFSHSSPNLRCEERQDCDCQHPEARQRSHSRDHSLRQALQGEAHPSLPALVEVFGGFVHWYKRMQAETPMLLTKYSKLLWVAPAQFDKMDPETFSALYTDTQKRVSEIQQRVAQIHQTSDEIEDEIVGNEGNGEGHSLAAQATRATEDETAKADRSLHSRPRRAGSQSWRPRI